MITVFAIFGTLIAIGTIADGILNIMKLEIIPEKFLQVALNFIAFNYTYSAYSGFPRILSLQ